MDKDKYDKIKDKYGEYASWAIWDTSLLDYKAISKKIKPNIVMVGLNAPNSISKDFKNFHGSPGYDEKLKCAFGDPKFEGIKFEGAYMTDIIKFRTIKDKNINASKSGEVMKYLKDHPEVERKNVKSFEKELKFIGSKKSLIIALGRGALSILKRNGFNGISNSIWIYHHAYRFRGYSDPIKYREKVLEMIKQQLSK